MDDVCSVIVIDDNALVAHSCQHMFNEAGLPWTVTRFGRLHDVVWPEGRTLAILDLHLDDGSRPAEIIGELTRRSIPVVVYTSCDDPAPIREAIAAGAASVVSRGAANQDLIDAVRAALEGCPGAGHDWARAPERDESPAADGLSDQEVRVLALYAGGMKSSRVARTLGLSVPTVNTCIARIREKYRGTGRPTAGS